MHDGAGHDERAGRGIEAGIVWFDAHGDVQTLETTTSGYLGGLPLRLLVGYRPELIASRLGLHAVPERQVALVGARDLDPPEVSYLAAAQIRRCEVDELDAAGLPGGPLYVHLDLDVIDPAQLPGLRFPAPGGPSPAQVAGALDMLLGTGRVAAIGVEYLVSRSLGHGADQASPRRRTGLKRHVGTVFTPVAADPDAATAP